MTWIPFSEAARILRVSERHLFRMMKHQKVMSQKNEMGKTEVWIEEQTADPTVSAPLDLPLIPAEKLTDDVMTKVNAMLESIAAEKDILSTEMRVACTYSIPTGTQRRYKAQLRDLYGIPTAQPIHQLAHHPQIKQALAQIVVRKSPSNTGELRSARGLIVVKETGEYLDAEAFLIALYSRPGHNAKSCYLALADACRKQRVLNEATNDVATVDDLPSMSSVIRFLSTKRETNVAIKRSRMSKSERDTDRIYISRPDDEYRPGGVLEGDHTEDVTIVYRRDGKIAPLWSTMLVDRRTGLIKGYVHAYTPSSQTIALCTRNAFLGTQLFAAVGSGPDVKYEPANIVDACDKLYYDRGKDYKSRYTGQVIGKIDFEDDVRNQVQLLCKLEHTQRRHPQSKGTVEGTFAIIQKVLKYLPGFKGSNYSKKPDDLSAQVKAGLILYEDEYRSLFQLAVNMVNNRPRKSLGNVSPLQFYMMNSAGMRYIDERVLNILMMKVEKRIIRRGYVKLLGAEYFSMDLDPYNGEQATLYYDPMNVGRVAVYIGADFITFAVDKKLLGVTERDWMRFVKERERQNRDLADEIRSLREGITSDEARAILFNAEIQNISKVERTMIAAAAPKVLQLTGIEAEARKFHQELAKQMKKEEVEKKKEETIKGNPLNLINVEKLR